MKKYIAILGLFVIFGCENNSTLAPSKFKTIMIKSVGEVEVLPDMAMFQVALSCLDRSVKTSKDCLVEKSNELTDKLKSFGIAEEDILTTSVNLNKSYTWRNGSSVFEGYRSETTMYVTIKKIDDLDVIYTELLENRNLELGGLNYAHSQMDSLQNEAYVKALEKSSLLTDKLLTELPETEKEILKIGNVEITSSLPEAEDANRNYEMVQAEAKAVNSSVAINKGTVRVQATLFVEYQIR
ncbi:MAG: SIMPL domain-containing protein [Leeuwenhoekiella sp.]